MLHQISLQIMLPPKKKSDMFKSPFSSMVSWASAISPLPCVPWAPPGTPRGDPRAAAAPRRPLGGMDKKVVDLQGGAPPVINWCISPWTIDISPRNHREIVWNWSSVRQLSVHELGHHRFGNWMVIQISYFKRMVPDKPSIALFMEAPW